MSKKTLDDVLPLGSFCKNTCPTSMVYADNLTWANGRSSKLKERGEENIAIQINLCHRNCIAYHFSEYSKSDPQ